MLFLLPLPEFEDPLELYNVEDDPPTLEFEPEEFVPLEDALPERFRLLSAFALL